MLGSSTDSYGMRNTKCHQLREATATQGFIQGPLLLQQRKKIQEKANTGKNEKYCLKYANQLVQNYSRTHNCKRIENRICI